MTASDVLGSRAHHPQPMAKAGPRRSITRMFRSRAQSSCISSVDWPCSMDCRSSIWGRALVREMVRLKFAGDDAVLVPPADLALIWPYAAELGKLTLDKADGSTWWERRGEAEREIQIAAKELAKHIAQRRRRRASKLVAPGSGLREVRCALSVFHDG